MDMATQLGILGGLFLIAGVLWFPIAVVASVLIGLGVGCIAYSIGQIVQQRGHDVRFPSLLTADLESALDAYAEAVRRDARAQMPCYHLRRLGINCLAWNEEQEKSNMRVTPCPSCAARAEQEQR